MSQSVTVLCRVHACESMVSISMDHLSRVSCEQYLNMYTCCVQDWLTQHKLDRNALLKLKENCESYRAWCAWEATQNGAAPSNGGASGAQNSTVQCKQEEQGTDANGATEEPEDAAALLAETSEVSDGAGLDAMDIDDPAQPSASACTDAADADEAVNDRENGASEGPDDASEDILGGLPDDVSAATDTTDAVLVPCPLHEANALDSELEEIAVEAAVQDSEGGAAASGMGDGEGASNGGGAVQIKQEGAAAVDMGTSDEREEVKPDVKSEQDGKDSSAAAAAAQEAPATEGSEAVGASTSGEGATTNAAPEDDVVALPSGAWKARCNTLVPLASEFCRLSYEFKAQDAIASLRDALGKPAISKGPLGMLGRPVRVFWPDDGVWYTAEIVSWHPESKKHTLLYHDDDEEEQLDLEEEDKAGRLQWLLGASSTEWSTIAAPRVRGNNASASSTVLATQRVSTEGAGAGASTSAGPAADRSTNGMARAPAMKGGVEQPTSTETGEPIPQAAISISWRVSVFWEESDTWFKGVIDSYDASVERHRVVFDDGEHQWVDFSLYPVKWLKPDAREEAAVARHEHTSKARALADEALAKAQAEAAERAQNAPDQVRIVCNGHYAQLLVRQTSVITDSGQRLSPTEFERLSGKGAAKKWKVCAASPLSLQS